MPAEWFIDISASAVVAWAMGDKVHMQSSRELWPLSRNVAWEEDEASDSSASAVRWIEDGLVAVGDRSGVVRIFRVDGGTWGLTAVAAYCRERVDQVLLSGFGCWVRCGNKLGLLSVDEGFGSFRLLPGDTRDACWLEDSWSAVAVGVEPAIGACSWVAGKPTAAKTLIRGVAGAVWGAFFSRDAAVEDLPPGEKRWSDGVPFFDGRRAEDDRFEKCNTFALLSDSRVGVSVAASPCGRLAAVGDDVGRVLLVDVRVGRVIRVWKGVRGALCGFCAGPDRALCLAMLAPRRGLVHVYRMRFGRLVAALRLASPAASWRLVSCQDRCYVASKDDNNVRVKAIDVPAEQVESEQCYYPSGRDAKAARALRVARRGRDAAGAVEALGQIGDVGARGRALDEAARTCDFEMLTSLVAAATADDDPALSNSAERVAVALAAASRLAVMQCDDEGDRGAAASAFPEAAAWLDVAGDDTADVLGGTAIKAMRDALGRVGATEAGVDGLARQADESFGSFYRGWLVWKALGSGRDDDWRRAVEASFAAAVEKKQATALEGDTLSVAENALCRAASHFAASLFQPLRGDVFALRELEAAEVALDLGRIERARLCAAWIGSLPAQSAVAALPLLARWFKDDVLGGRSEAAAVIAPVVEARLDSQAPAQLLALTTAALDAATKKAELIEAKTYGDVAVDDPSWGIAALEGALDELRVACVLQLGPPRAHNATIRSLNDGSSLIAELVAADAFAAQADFAFVLSDEPDALPRYVQAHPERGWTHACFADLDRGALAASHALACLAAADGGGLAALCVSAASLLCIFRARGDDAVAKLAVAAAAVVWRVAAAPLLADAMRPSVDLVVDDLTPRDHDDDKNLVDSCGALVDIFVEYTSTKRARSDVKRLLDTGTCFATTESAWPSGDLGPHLRQAWADFETRPVNAQRAAQLAKLHRCLALALQVDDLPLSCVADLFGLGEANNDHLLDLETPPRDDVAAFADLAEAALRDATTSSHFADQIRQATHRRKVAALVDRLQEQEDEHQRSRDDKRRVVVLAATLDDYEKEEDEGERRQPRLLLDDDMDVDVDVRESDARYEETPDDDTRLPYHEHNHRRGSGSSSTATVYI